MDKGYIHVEIKQSQASKKPGDPCGDVVAYDRTTSSTTLVLSDGLGHGIKAHISAQMCTARILGLLRRGYSLRRAASSVAHTMNEAKETGLPYAAFTIARILNDGVATVLTYETPLPVFVASSYANVLPQRTLTLDGSIIGETNFHVTPGEGIVLVSDGITQAGLGLGLTHGWTIEGVRKYINDCLTDGLQLMSIPSVVLAQAHEVWKKKLGDDCTVTLAACRWGKTVTILTGPPLNRKSDRSVVSQFLMMDGTKVVSGGTTARIVADYLGSEVAVEDNQEGLLAPAKYHIPGIDLVVEGAVTLNQFYNVIDEDPSSFDEQSGVTELHALLREADCVNILVGGAINPANVDISFRQKGILSRRAIIPLIVERLQKAGKLVVVKHV